MRSLALHTHSTLATAAEGACLRGAEILKTSLEISDIIYSLEH